jgi:alkylated DNA repair dioxygenase AlkB
MQQLELFADYTPTIPGLTYIPEYIDSTEEFALLKNIDAQNWDTGIKRRVQHYGYKYDYNTRRLGEAGRAEPIPSWLQNLCNKLKDEELVSAVPDQVIINEYMPKQGIAPHIDCPVCFGDTICAISLGSNCIMDFIGEKSVPFWLEARSLLVMQGDARYHWKHGIAPRKFDKYNSTQVARQRRVSITFRRLRGVD